MKRSINDFSTKEQVREIAKYRREEQGGENVQQCCPFVRRLILLMNSHTENSILIYEDLFTLFSEYTNENQRRYVADFTIKDVIKRYINTIKKDKP